MIVGDCRRRGKRYNPDIVDPGIRPVCEAINAVPGSGTLWSCHGHPLSVQDPYVVFEMPLVLARLIHRALGHGKAGGRLRFVWRITADFDPEEHFLRFILRPDDRRLERWPWPIPRFRRNVMDAELRALASVIRDATVPQVFPGRPTNKVMRLHYG